MDRFIHHQNLLHYAERLDAERDAAKRQRLKAFLFEEADRFGTAQEKLREVDDMIAESKARIARQELVATRLSSEGGDIAAVAEDTLARMNATLGILQDCRRWLAEGKPND